MKRSLRVVGQESSAATAEPEALCIGDSTVVIRDGGSGTAAHRLADSMVDAGAVRVDFDVPEDAIRVLIRDGDAFIETAAEPSGDGADFVLGSVRPAFARHLVEKLLRESHR